MIAVTTIKVSKDLRDRLQERAAADHTSLGDAIERLLDLAARAERFERIRSERRGTDAAHDELLEQASLADLLAEDP